MQKISTFLMFEGRADEAMKFYVSIFKNSHIDLVARYGPEQKHVEGKVVHGEFTLDGQRFMAMDSAVTNNPTFNHRVSLYVECETEAEIDSLYQKLSRGGSLLWKLDKYPFSEKYAWVNDKFGVSWQMFLVKPK